MSNNPEDLTRYPVPSTAFIAAERNAADLDRFMNQSGEFESRNGTVRPTLSSALANIGYLPPVTYSGGIVFTSGDSLKTVLQNGQIYAPRLSLLPFTTPSLFDDDQWFIISGVSRSQTQSVTHNTRDNAAADNNSQRQFIRVGDFGGAEYKRTADQTPGDFVDVSGNRFRKNSDTSRNVSLSRSLLTLDPVHNFPVRFGDYDQIIADGGYSFLFPQCATVTEGILYICYGADGGDSANWIVRYNFNTGQYLSCFGIGQNIVEGIEVVRHNGSLYIYTRIADNNLGRYDITSTPANRSRPTINLTGDEVRLHSMFFRAGDRLYVQRRTTRGDTTSRHIFSIYDFDLNLLGQWRLEKFPATLTGGDQDGQLKKLQTLAHYNGVIVGSYGGTFSTTDGTPATIREAQGVGIFSASGNYISESIWNPASAAQKFTDAGISNNIIEHEGAFSYEGRLYSLIVTHGHANENAPNSGVVIAELGNGGPINLEENNFRLQPNGITTQEEIQGVFRGGLDNPLTGEEMDTIQSILDYMRDSGQTNYSFYSSALSIEDLNGNAIPVGTFVHLRGVNGSTFTMEWIGNFTRVMYWIVGTTQTRSRTSYLNSVLQTGDVRPDTDNSRDIGSGTLRYDDIFATNGAINTSDEREKDVSEIPESWYKAAKKHQGSPV